MKLPMAEIKNLIDVYKLDLPRDGTTIDDIAERMYTMLKYIYNLK